MLVEKGQGSAPETTAGRWWKNFTIRIMSSPGKTGGTVMGIYGLGAWAEQIRKSRRSASVPCPLQSDVSNEGTAGPS